jgi:hypothetical protein
MSSAGRHLRSVRTPGAPQAAPERAIAVRFTSTAGLIARRRRPLNSFRWVGPGTLHLTAHGILITAKRSTLLGLRPSEHFIPAAEIHDVYREGSAVQVHLRGPRNAYFRLWTEDAASAAQLVAALPTRRTIEFESEFNEPQVASSWHMPLGWLIALLATAVAAVVIWFAGHRAEVRRDLPLPPPPASAAPARNPVSPEDVLLAQADLTRFAPRIVTLEAEFTLAFNALMDGRVSQENFADELEQWLLPQWDDLEAQLHRTHPAAGSLQQRADADLMAAINNWQLATRAYTDDLRNQRFVQKPFVYMGRAYVHRWRAERMQTALERGPPYDLEAAH